MSSPYEHNRPPLVPRLGPWIFLLAVVAGVLLWQSLRSPALHDPNAQPRAVAARGDLAADEKATIELFRGASPSVVFITTERVRRRFFDVLRVPEGNGSGFIWNRKGHVITNYHVIRNADAAHVTLADRATYEAKLVGASPDHDVAVLFINAPASKLAPIAVGESKGLQVGQKVFAIGNPFGLDHSLSTGVVSALGREISAVTGRTISGVIQTDAAINPGNSGGPLLDSAGRLVGVNTAILSPSGTSAGVGFAVPIDTVNQVVARIIKQGEVTRPGLGIDVRDGRAHGLEGVVVFSVKRGSAGERAGLRPVRVDAFGRTLVGDVIVGVNGTEVRTGEELIDTLEKHEAGDQVTLEVIRGGRRIRVKAELQELSLR